MEQKTASSTKESKDATSSSSLFSIVGMIWIIFDKQKQGLHDKLAETYVIKES